MIASLSTLHPSTARFSHRILSSTPENASGILPRNRGYNMPRKATNLKILLLLNTLFLPCPPYSRQGDFSKNRFIFEKYVVTTIDNPTKTAFFGILSVLQ